MCRPANGGAAVLAILKAKTSVIGRQMDDRYPSFVDHWPDNCSRNGAVSSQSGRQFSPVTEQAQMRLAQLGFDPGTADGISGPRTSAAIKEFQKQSGLPETGTLDSATQAKLNSGCSGAPGRTRSKTGDRFRHRTSWISSLPIRPMIPASPTPITGRTHRRPIWIFQEPPYWPP